MKTETLHPSHEAHEEATNEAATAPIDAMWAQLVPGAENAATAPVELAVDLDDSDDIDDDAHADESPIAGRAKSNTALRKIVGRRLQAARELSGFGQTEAALLMGWKNATQLSLIEQGKRMPPHQVLIIASTVLGISVDFLLGLDSEPERDSRTAARNAKVRQIADMLHRNAEAVTKALFESHRFDPAPELRASRVITKVTSLCEAVGRFHAINPEFFENCRGSATLLRTANDASVAIAKVNTLLEQADRRAEFSLQQGRAAIAGEDQNTVGGQNRR